MIRTEHVKYLILNVTITKDPSRRQEAKELQAYVLLGGVSAHRNS
jgi:hypothetical protein